jgi:hypothetical protein
MRNLFLTFLLSPVFLFGQDDFCSKKFDDSFYPLVVGQEKNLTWGESNYVEKVTGTREIDGVTYYEFKQDFGKGTSYDLLLRKQNDTVYLYDDSVKKENILLIARPEKGVSWHSGKVIETEGFFETPYCDYNNLLVVEYKYSSGTKEKRYYKKGLGLVAVTSKYGIKGMCIPNKEESLALLKPLAAQECTEIEDKEEVKKCTMSFINNYVNTELAKRKIKTPKEEGTLEFKIKISKDGNVTEVKAANSIKGGKQLRKVISEIIYDLPKFRPVMTSKTKSVGTNMTLSIPIKTN